MEPPETVVPTKPECVFFQHEQEEKTIEIQVLLQFLITTVELNTLPITE